jgi:hypothetical protein
MANEWPSVLEGLVDKDVYSNLLNELKKNDGLPKAIDRTIAGLTPTQPSSHAVSTRLCFLQDLYEIVQKDTQLFRFIAADDRVKTVADVAATYYDVDQHNGPPHVDDDMLEKYKAELLRQEPTSTLLNMVHDLDFTQKEVVISLLKKAVKDGFDISRTSVSVLFLKPEYVGLVPTPHQRSIRGVLETLQRLCALVTDSLGLLCLMQTKFTSARLIASTRKADFVEAMEQAGASKASAQAIYEQI